MDSPLQLIDGDIRHAILTTYSLNLAFVERWVVPMLRDRGATNIVVLVDESQLGQALTDSRPSRAGREYHLVATRLGPGAFHPKIIYLASEDWTRACVSSANLTVDGQLRNVEAGVALDSSELNCLPALNQLAAFLRGVTADAPQHVRDAVHAAVADLAPTDSDDADFQLMHNLEQRIVDQIPDFAALAYVTAYADTGRAASELAARGDLTVHVDAASFEAPASFFEGDWDIDARTFGRRRLHGKVAINARADWSIVGSANLSEPALLRRAEAGNVEAAVLIRGHVLDVPGEPWDGDHATLRSQAARSTSRSDAPAVRSFNSWLDASALCVAGVPDGTMIEAANGAAWVDIGPLVGGRVGRPLTFSVYRLRAVVDGRELRSLVHDPRQLTAVRLRTAAGERTSHLLTQLPVDAKDLAELTHLIEQLALIGHASEAGLGAARDAADTEDGELAQWLPADPLGQPTIPPLLRGTWSGDADAFIALVRNALRLPSGITAAQHDEYADDEYVAEPGEDAEDAAPDDRPDDVRDIQRRVLNKYRKAFGALMDNAPAWITSSERGDTAALIFQTVLRLQEQLASTTVRVDGVEEAFLDEESFMAAKLAVLDSYFARPGEPDSLCVATAGYHLACCLHERDVWDALDWEAVKLLAVRLAPQLMDDNEQLSDAAADAGVEVQWIHSKLDPFQSSWEPIVEEAEGYLLGDFQHGDDPLHFVAGEARFEKPDDSDAWHLIALASTLAFTTGDDVAVIIRNRHPKSLHEAHVVLLCPQGGVLLDAFQRRRDNEWVVRSHGAGRDTLEALRGRGTHAIVGRRKVGSDVPEAHLVRMAPVIELAERLATADIP